MTCFPFLTVMVPLTRLFMNHTKTQIHNENWKWSHKAKYGTFPHAPLSLSHTNTCTHTHTIAQTADTLFGMRDLEDFSITLPVWTARRTKQRNDKLTSSSCSRDIQHIDQSRLPSFNLFIRQSFAMVRKSISS